MRGLSRLYVLRLPALRAFDHIELYLLAFLQAAESAGLNGRVVHENVLTVQASHQTIAIGIVKQLHSQCNASNPTAEHFWVQEVGIKGQNVALGSRRCHHPSITEHIAIAQTVIGMVENIEHLRL